MDPDTEQIIHRFYARFVSGTSAASSHSSPRTREFVNPPEAVEGGIRRGRAAVIDVLQVRDGQVSRLAWFRAREDAAAEAGV